MGAVSATWIYGGYDPRHEYAVLDIVKERRRQEQLKAEGRFRYTAADAGMSNTERLACLTEEVGEVAQEVLTQAGRRLARDTEGSVEGLRKEITQVAAICLAWLESDCNAVASEEMHAHLVGCHCSYDRLDVDAIKIIATCPVHGSASSEATQ